MGINLCSTCSWIITSPIIWTVPTLITVFAILTSIKCYISFIKCATSSIKVFIRCLFVDVSKDNWDQQVCIIEHDAAKVTLLPKYVFAFGTSI